jgi:hypothetical protein
MNQHVNSYFLFFLSFLTIISIGGLLIFLLLVGFIYIRNILTEPFSWELVPIVVGMPVVFLRVVDLQFLRFPIEKSEINDHESVGNDRP